MSSMQREAEMVLLGLQGSSVAVVSAASTVMVVVPGWTSSWCSCPAWHPAMNMAGRKVAASHRAVNPAAAAVMVLKLFIAQMVLDVVGKLFEVV